MRQTEKLLQYFKNTKPTITTWEAWERLGISRLHDVVFKLRHGTAGGSLSGRTFKITSIPCNVKNRDGENCRIAVYEFADGGAK